MDSNYGVLEGTRPDTVDVGTSSVQISQAKPRKVLYIRNSSSGSQNITIVLGNIEAVDKKGIVLSPGQAYTDSSQAGYKCWGGQIQAISSSASGKVSIFERS